MHLGGGRRDAHEGQGPGDPPRREFPRAISTLSSFPLARPARASTPDTLPLDTQNTLDRCTNGEGNLWDYTVAEIEALDAGSHFSPDAAGERIPRLTALLQCCRDLSLGLNLEVKHVT